MTLSKLLNKLMGIRSETPLTEDQIRNMVFENVVIVKGDYTQPRNNYVAVEDVVKYIFDIKNGRRD